MQNYREAIQLLNRQQLFSLAKILHINPQTYRSSKPTPIKEFGETLTVEDIENLSPFISQRIEVENRLSQLSKEIEQPISKCRKLFCLDRFNLKDDIEIESILLKNKKLGRLTEAKHRRLKRHQMILKEYQNSFKNKPITQKDLSNFVQQLVIKTGNKTRTIQDDILTLGLRKNVNEK